MSSGLRLLFVLHNHQPVDNFDHVLEDAYQDSYRKFLDVFQDFAPLKMALHTSGPLMEWLEERHPDYVDRLAEQVAAGRVEIVGGAFYEPILTMIPSRDRIGQIERYRQWLHQRLGADVQGMWMPERVWEQPLVKDLVAAGVNYTLLDDFHFKCAGLRPDELHGYYLTEDEGSLLRVFPGSERLRYLIPFASPEETIEYLRQFAERHPESVIVFADDGEKLGAWPGTREHVYDRGWLRRFFELILANDSWLTPSTPAEVIRSVPPAGKLYLPEGSYREMTEWCLPASELSRFEQLRHDLQHQGIWPNIQSFVRGGFWRNFKRKYPESDEMYARMMMVSQRLDEATRGHGSDPRLEEARQALYRGQCNCGYWHGAFGGIYLPHLRASVYRHLIAADNLLEQVAGRGIGSRSEGWTDADSADFNLDDRPEVRLANEQLVALIAPSTGGQLYQLDVRSIRHNLLATLARRPEAYHGRILAGPDQGSDDVSSIHEQVIFKQEGLEQDIHYDAYPRKSLLDHFFDTDTDLSAVSVGAAAERGDFVGGQYSTRIRRGADRVQVILTREAAAAGHDVKLTKSVMLVAGDGALHVAYLLEGLPQETPLHFGVEFNFAGLPGAAEGRYFKDASGTNLGDLGTSLDVNGAESIGLVDEWLGMELELASDQSAAFWTFPIYSVNQSEGGFERVHQSVVVMPHWQITADHQGTFRAQMKLTVNTSAADKRSSEAVAVTSS